MAKPKRPGGPKQKLSPAAAKRKAARDLKIAKTPRRTRYKAETQKKRREAKKKGISVEGKDWDHNTNSFVSEKKNRSATKTTNNTLKDKKKKPTMLDKAKAKKKPVAKKKPTKKPAKKYNTGQKTFYGKVMDKKKKK